MFISGVSESGDYVRFTNFNTDGNEQHDFFPFDESSGYGFFVVDIGSADENKALSISRDQNLVIHKGSKSFVFTIGTSRSIYTSLDTLFSGTGAISQKAIDDTSEYGTFFADYRNWYLYGGGIGKPTPLLNGRLERFYQNLPNSFKDNLILKWNHQREELWVYLQTCSISGLGSCDEPINKYAIFVYSVSRNNFKKLEPLHLIRWMGNESLDKIVEIAANDKVQKWDYGFNKVYKHDNQIPPEPFIETHKVAIDVSQVEMLREVYAEYDVEENFRIQVVLNGQIEASVVNDKLFDSVIANDFRPLRLASNSSKFSVKVKFGNIPNKQKIREFGLTYIPRGGAQIGRRTY